MKETTYLLASINSTSDPFRRDSLVAEMRGVIEKLEADAQALADVRTLDAWVAKAKRRSVEIFNHVNARGLGL